VSAVDTSGSTGLRIGIHFDLICPWCFIGKRQLELARGKFAQQRPGIPVESQWHPMQLLPDMPEAGLPFAEFYEKRLGSPEAVRQRQQQVALAANSVGLDLDLTRIERMPNTARAHDLLRRVASLEQPDLYERLLERLFAAYFQRREDIGDAATLHRLAAEVGVPLDRISDATPIDARAARNEPAVPGVPYFVFNNSLALSGAHDSAILFMAMSQAAQATAATDARLP